MRSDLGNFTEGEKVSDMGGLVYLGVIRQTGDVGFYRVSVGEE